MPNSFLEGIVFTLIAAPIAIVIIWHHSVNSQKSIGSDKSTINDEIPNCELQEIEDLKDTSTEE
jgi:hypothetical protein